MPTAMPPNPRPSAAEADDLDNVLDYDQAVNDFLRDIPVNSNENNTTHVPTAQNNQDPDAEIQVRKQRKPVPKLDEARLLSNEGIPKLRRVTKSKLKFKGKGHEFSDISRMLNLYQLWLDDLYPRAKFRDGLSMVEKAGHSKRMQITRRGWMDATRARHRAESVERIGDAETSGAAKATGEGDQVAENPAEDRNSDDRQTQNAPRDYNDIPEDDELDALMGETADAPVIPQASMTRPKGPFEEDDADEDDDDLDALIAEHTANLKQPTTPASNNQNSEHLENFADEEEIMAGMDW